MVQPDAGPVGHLYIHVPFCARKCEYCAFFSEASNGELINRYTQALVLELEMVAQDLQPKTIFFGGGTPSILNLAQWKMILQGMHRLGLGGAGEWTVECNPATVSLEKAKLLRDSGVNRISMGVQSLDEKLLDGLGRVHSREMVFKSWDTLRKAGFDNINLDVMFAIPGQSMETWTQTLEEIFALGSEHLSCYEVIYEEDTPLFEQMKAGKIQEDEDLASAMYEELVCRASTAGFHQYEVANFARATPGIDRPGQVPRRACWHNVNYWRGGDFYGLGPSATGYVRGVRTKNWSNTQLHCEQIERGQRAFESKEKLPPLGRAGETAAFGLRMLVGWPYEQFREVTGFDLASEWAGEMRELTGKGWAVADQHHFYLTREGLRFADAAAQLFLR